MYKTAHFSIASQMDFWPAAFGGFASDAFDASTSSPHWLMWGLLNFGTAAEAAADFQAHFTRETESNELQLLQTLALNPAIESVGVPTPPAFLVIDYF
jgi:hypothetical protein